MLQCLHFQRCKPIDLPYRILKTKIYVHIHNKIAIPELTEYNFVNFFTFYFVLENTVTLEKKMKLSGNGIKNVLNLSKG